MCEPTCRARVFINSKQVNQGCAWFGTSIINGQTWEMSAEKRNQNWVNFYAFGCAMHLWNDGEKKRINPPTIWSDDSYRKSGWPSFLLSVMDGWPMQDQINQMRIMFFTRTGEKLQKAQGPWLVPLQGLARGSTEASSLWTHQCIG